MKRARVQQRVRIADPVHIASRFFRPEFGGIIGAGGMIIPREVIDDPCQVVMVADKGTRVCVEWIQHSLNYECSPCSMWLDADCLELARR